MTRSDASPASKLIPASTATCQTQWIWNQAGLCTTPAVFSSDATVSCVPLSPSTDAAARSVLRHVLILVCSSVPVLSMCPHLCPSVHPHPPTCMQEICWKVFQYVFFIWVWVWIILRCKMRNSLSFCVREWLCCGNSQCCSYKAI